MFELIVIEALYHTSRSYLILRALPQAKRITMEIILSLVASLRFLGALDVDDFNEFTTNLVPCPNAFECFPVRYKIISAKKTHHGQIPNA